MTANEIFQWSLGEGLDYFEFNKVVMKYVRWMGEQMDEFSMMSYYRNNKYEWIIYDVKKKKLLNFSIGEEDLESAVNEYITWYESNYGEVKCNYNVFP